jgi:catechol 2,3-dioxygenase-like lactoylglutathione lyase family enzyme
MTPSIEQDPMEADGPALLAIERIGLTVGDLNAAQAFYADALGFRTTALETREGDAFCALTGLADAHAQAAVMWLGNQTLELLQFETPGQPYPNPRAANDPWFQHFAIAVRDMDTAFARVSRHAQQPISTGGPQRLPPSTGNVTAYKFRDPDGHPLELSYAPQSPWADDPNSSSMATLGIDHSALAVADLDASLSFYTEGLGLRLAAPALNQGPEQSALDGLDGPIVDIATLFPRDAGPHIELLHYRTPKTLAAPRRTDVNDIAAVRLVLRVVALDAFAQRLAAAAVLSDGIVTTPHDRRFLLRDPDGHLLELVEVGPANSTRGRADETSTPGARL